MRQGGELGSAVVIGGAEDRGREAEILREFVRLAGGAREDFAEVLFMRLLLITAWIVSVKFAPP
jgi:cyanophycinase-like exopeptidase